MDLGINVHEMMLWFLDGLAGGLLLQHHNHCHKKQRCDHYYANHCAQSMSAE
jgi:hypothetical protein